MAWLSTWLTPIWILGVGALLGLAVLLLLWGLLALIRPSAAARIPELVLEGALMPIFWITVGLAVFGVAGFPLAADRMEILASAARLPYVGTATYSVTAAAAVDDTSEPAVTNLGVRFRPDELRSIDVESNSDLEITIPGGDPPVSFEVTGGEAFTADAGRFRFGEDEVTSLQVVNLGERDAVVTVTVSTSPRHPQAATIPIAALSIVLPFVVYMLLQAALPRASAVGLATAKSEMSQPLFLILVLVGVFLIGLFLFIPYHTFGEDIKVLKDSGLTLIMIFTIIQAVWAASNSVADEIDGKTAMTVLSKPIGRRQFILGKFLGISWTSFAMFVMLGAWLLIIVAYKPIYDARETANTDPTWQACHAETMRTIPGLALAFMETLIFVSISIAISTRLPLLANVMICFAIYAFGHLTPLLVVAGEKQFETVKFFARFISTVLPVLDHYNIQAAVAAGVGVPLAYLGWAAVYCVLYCAIAMLLALVLFEDRDLA